MNQPVNDAARLGSKAQRSDAYRGLVTVGLMCFGLIHLVLGWMCIQIAMGSGGGDASTQGALKDLVSKPFGNVLMIIVGVGMVALIIWQIVEAIFGYSWMDDKKRLRKRLSSAGRAIVYAALAFTALNLAISGRSSDSNQGAKSVSATLMGAPFGQFLVGLVGVAIAAVGVSQIVKGIKKKFVEEDLRGGVPDWAKKLGMVGWSVKGIALVLVGLLFAWAALTFDPQKAAGIDGALKTLREQPFGMFLLILMGLGFVGFGAYCFVWSRNARHADT